MIVSLVRHTARRWANAWRLARLEARFPGTRISPLAVIAGAQTHKVEFAEGVLIGAFSFIILEADPHGAMPRPSLSIGAGTYIGEQNNIRINAPTTIGRNCLISQGCALITSNHSRRPGELIQEQGWDMTKFGLTIEDDVWVGANACILPGVTLGRGCIVGAGSVVTRSVDPWAIVVGAPAAAIGSRAALSQSLRPE